MARLRKHIHRLDGGEDKAFFREELTVSCERGELQGSGQLDAPRSFQTDKLPFALNDVFVIH